MQKAHVTLKAKEITSTPSKQQNPRPLQEQDEATCCPHCQSYIDYLGCGKWGCENCDIK